ncbi:NAD(P)-dependent oxidoreductase [Chelatococcus sp. GCM10030263]|uniref:NAD(P)-dependent oxidoreductase n=1 Tax=Chelatococcus sp. GCM10030263 TaxID=3273387 RepID=UPI00361CF9FF
MDSSTPPANAKSSLTIICHLSEERRTALARHPARPAVLPALRPEAPWQIPQDAEILFTEARGWNNAPQEAPSGWPGSLRWLHVVGAGIDGYPDWIRAVPAITCGRGVNANAIAEYVLGAILLHDKRFLECVITDAADWRPLSLRGLSGKTLGLLGLGAIGTEVARRAQAFDMRIKAFRRSGAPPMDKAVALVDSAAELFAISDHLVLAAPLTPETRHIVSREALARAKPGLHLVNISRGGLIDDEALLAALDEGRIATATLDVTEPEPLPAGHVFYRHPRVRVTPHCSWSAEDVTAKIMQRLFANIDRYLAGTALHDQVDRQLGY